MQIIPLFSFYRLGMALYFIELISQLMFHKSRLMYYAGYKMFSTFVYRFWIIFYVPIRFAKMAVGIYVLWYGLRRKGNFGTMFLIISIQCYMLYNLFKVISSRNTKNMLAFEGAGTAFRKA
uniref:Uncharacterized protein n=1 Tax=Panagrolaimus davidi TaxID=227884 RepID=A0A914QGH8_9BILA